MLNDIRYALRTLRKSPAFTLIAILTLALGIGANAALFSVVNGVLLNPLPYPHSEQLVAIFEKNAGVDRGPISYLNFLDWQRQTQAFSSIAIYRHEDYNFTGQGPGQRLNGSMISSSFFPTLGVAPILGRNFTSADDRIGAGPVVLLSAGLWKRRFGASPSILGQSIALNGEAYTVIGVVPPGFAFYGIDRDIYTPIGQWSDPSFLDRRVDMSAHAVGRLKPGVSLAQAQADMDSIARNLAAAYPEADKDVGIALVSTKEDIIGNVQPFLLVLLAAVGFLLLIACANVASLLLARSMRRSGEFAIRSALGASPTRILRQLLTESTLLAGAGCLLGLALAWGGTKAIVAFLPAALPRANEVSLDLRVVLFTIAISLVSGIVFGLAPALRPARINLAQILRESGRGSSGTRHRLHALFVSAEVALALVLLIGAGLMVRSLAALWRVDPGFNPAHAITFSVSTPSTPNTTNAEIRARLRHFDQALSDIPGVQGASVTLGSRPMIHDSSLPFWIDGEPKPANLNAMHQALFYLAESGFQRAMGITLLRGRFISPQDNENAPHVIVIDDAFARAYFPHQNPIGHHIHLALFDVEPGIVGVVGHVKQWGPGGDPRAAIQAQFYYPFMQMPEKLMPLAADITAVVLRTQGDPTAVMDQVRRALAAVDPGDVIYAVQTMDDVIATSFAARRLTMLLLGIFAALALALACVGIYSVIAYLVGERTHEIGVRMALGAQRADVLRLVLAQGLRMALTGIAVGTAGALALTHLMTHQLFQITPHDPLTFATAALALLLVAISAAWIPAKKATKLDPLIALRRE